MTRLPVQTRSQLALLALGWTAFAVYGSLVPLKVQAVDLGDAIDRFTHLPPLWMGVGSRADWVANILLFVPLTFLWMGSLAYERSGVARMVAAIVLVPVAGAASVALEFGQIWFAERTVSLNDIAAETLGGALGVLLWLAMGRRLADWARPYFAVVRPQSKVQWLLQAYLIGFILYSVVPLDLTISLTELYHKYRRGQAVLIPFAGHYESPMAAAYQFIGGIAAFVPVGAWIAVRMRSRSGVPSPVGAAVLGGGLIAGVIEFTQLLTLGRFTDVTDVVLGAAGSAIGAWLVAWNGRRR